MTAHDWDACLSSGTLLEAVRRHVRGPRSMLSRKLRLVVAAIARRHTANEDIARVVEEVERLADGASTISEVGLFARRVVVEDDRFTTLLGALTDHDNFRSAKNVMYLPSRIGLEFRSQVPLDEQANLVRDVFGNPFCTSDFDPRWHTSTVVALASGMYDSRDFDAMPILADALQDAGCEDDRILSHCRGPGPHVRGCWVVDRVLGKE